MKIRKFTTLGAAGLLAGVMLLGVAASNHGASSVQAGNGCTTPTVTINSSQQSTVQQPCVTPSEVPTEGRVKTHTPTQTSTAEATNTAVATSTPQVVNTQAPAPSATRPSGGNEGASVRPPNTGSGGGTSGGAGIWLVALGAMLVALGGGSLIFGVRRRA